MEKKRQIAAVLILLALIGVIAYRHSTGKDLEKYEASFFDVFDTQTQIIGYASSKEQFSEQMSLIKDKFQYYNDLYDIYHDYEGMNNIKTINDNADRISAYRSGTDLARQSVNALRVNSQHSKPHIDKNQDQHIHGNTHCPCAVDNPIINL